VALCSSQRLRGALRALSCALRANSLNRRCKARCGRAAGATGLNMQVNKYSSKLTQNKSQGASQAMLYASVPWHLAHMLAPVRRQLRENGCLS
jgi:hypothetical protein